jgi:Peptidase family M48
MRFPKLALLVVAWAPVCSLAAQSQPTTSQPTTIDQVVDRIVSRENAEVTALKQYTPLVETYIQNTRQDKELGQVPAGDKYFLSRADLAKGVELRPMTENGGKHGLLSGLGGLFSSSMQYLPRGFLQMIFVDNTGFDRQHYRFEYVRREFLGEVRCLVFDLTPLPNAGKGRFIGRVWVEDQDYVIVRFNGTYNPGSRSNYYFHFDSWRVNAGPGLWLPAYVYSEETNLPYAVFQHLQFKSQTRLWGYNLGASSKEQELGKILVEAATPVRDQSDASKDLTPLQAQRAWDHQAEDNVVERLERVGLLAPRGEVDKALDTVVNNLEVTNNLDIQPEVRCRVVLTSTLESFTIGRTIVLSRGLIDVLPDEASLATTIAHELSHIVLGHRIGTQYAFNDRMLFKDEETFQHFGFRRPQSEEDAADRKGVELLKNSPYKDQLANAALFVQALNSRAKEIPNLISPHLGNQVPINAQVLNVSAPADSSKKTTTIAALPLGSRIKLDPWSDTTEMIKAKPTGNVSEREKMPFEVTPFMPYLIRQSTVPAQQPAVTAESKTDPAKKPE